MKVIDVPQNARVFLGTPENPLAEPLLASITALVYGLEGVEELHLPQCFALGVMDAPAQVLVIIVGANTSLSRVAKRAVKLLARRLPPTQTLDVWPIPFDSPFASPVRQANCVIERDPFCLPVFRKPKPWWRLLRSS